MNSRLVIPLPRAGQACTLRALIQYIVYLIILPLSTGMVSLEGVPWGWDAMNVFEARIWDLSLLLSGKAALVVLSKQPDAHPNRNDSSMCSGPRAIPATLLGWVAQL